MADDLAERTTEELLERATNALRRMVYQHCPHYHDGRVETTGLTADNNAVRVLVELGVLHLDFAESTGRLIATLKGK